MVRITDRPDMTSAVYCGRKALKSNYHPVPICVMSYKRRDMIRQYQNRRRMKA